jgi:hypothetical protein
MAKEIKPPDDYEEGSQAPPSPENMDDGGIDDAIRASNEYREGDERD